MTVSCFQDSPRGSPEVSHLEDQCRTVIHGELLEGSAFIFNMSNDFLRSKFPIPSIFLFKTLRKFSVFFSEPRWIHQVKQS